MSDRFQVPNCDDPVFIAWCQLCDLRRGHDYAADDPRIAQLEQLMMFADRDCGEPDDEDYLNPFGRH